jgi:hypothetical protein
LAGARIVMSKKIYIPRKTIANLQAKDCRWPVGDPREQGFHFCGAPQLAGRPYCELHWRMAFQPSRSSGTPRLFGSPPLKAA